MILSDCFLRVFGWYLISLIELEIHFVCFQMFNLKTYEELLIIFISSKWQKNKKNLWDRYVLRLKMFWQFMYLSTEHFSYFGRTLIEFCFK